MVNAFQGLSLRAAHFFTKKYLQFATDGRIGPRISEPAGCSAALTERVCNYVEGN